MTHTLAPEDQQKAHPASRVLALACVALVAQTPDAALIWLACFAVGLLLNRWVATHPAAPKDPPHSTPPPARRRTDMREIVIELRGQHPTPQQVEHRDTLTGLFSPQYLQDKGESLMHDLAARGLGLCVLRTGFDGLDDVVSRYGQEAVDEVMVQAARRLSHRARADDIVVRADARGFVLLFACPEAECATLAPGLKTRVLADLQRVFAYRTVHLRVSGRVGSAVWPLHAATIDGVIHHAGEVLTSARNRLPDFN